MREVLLVAGWDDPVAVDFALHASTQGQRRVVVLSSPHVLSQVQEYAETYPLERLADLRAFITSNEVRLAGVVMFLNHNGHHCHEKVIDEVAALAREARVGCVCLEAVS